MQHIVETEVGGNPLLATGAKRNDHLESFEEFFEHLNRAAKTVLPRSSRRYREVAVLLLQWQDDDLGTETEVNDLECLFQDMYHYRTERFLIPSSDSATQLEYKLNDFRKAYNHENDLLILYYGGHGSLDFSKQRPSRSIWQANRNGGASLVWSDLQGILERAKSDVVFILDCCFAASAARCAGSKEGLWACNSEVTTTGVNDNSFTRNLIEELKSLSTSRFNIAMLHARLMRRYRKPGPHMLLTEPWYTYLGDAALASAEISPQPSNQMSSASNYSVLDGSDSSSERPSAVTTISIDQSMTETLVLLAVRLKDTEQTPQLLSWQNWCHDLTPDDVESVHALGKLKIRDLIKLEAQFLSNSSLLLVSLPIFIWDRLPCSPAYSFVGFIKSANFVSPSWNPQLEVYLSSSTYKEDWTRVKTVEDQSEIEWNHQGGDEQNTQLRSKTDLAIDYEKQGLWGEAEKLFKEVVFARQSALGNEHPDTLTSMANLASMYRNQGRWTDAEELEVQVTEAFKRVFGEEHPSTLTSIVNLASTYRNQGRWKEAEELEVRVEGIRKRVLGEDHPDTLTSIANLASTFWNQGRWMKAEELEVQVLETRKRVLGEEHPSTLTSMANLASTYQKQGRYKEAEELFIKVTEASSRVLGEEHPSSLTSIANLASTYKSQGRAKEAEELFIYVMETRKRVLGEEHPSTLTTMNNLALVLDSQFKYEEAEMMYRRTLETSEKVLGPEHLDTLTSVYHLAHLLAIKRHYDESTALYERAYAGLNTSLGTDHPITRACRENYSQLLSSQEQDLF